MDEVVAWLTGVLDEIEQKAHALPGAPWTLHITDYAYVNSGGEPIATVGGPQSVPIAEHIALNDPRAVLARVEAERALAAEHVAAKLNDSVVCQTCDAGAHEFIRSNDPDTWPCESLRLLAYGHRFDAPGYQDSWAPPS